MDESIPGPPLIGMVRAAISQQIGAIAAAEPAVRAHRDDEALHDMRVASRRLRAVVDVFAPLFPEKALRRRRRELKALTTALGAAREWDVHTARIEKERTNAAGETERAALDYVLLRLRGRQAEEHAAMATALEQLNPAGAGARLMRLVESARPDDALDLAGLAASVIPPRVADAWGNMASRRDTDDFEVLHRARIAMKKLRYVLEVLEPAFRDRKAWKKLHAEAKDIQDALGKHHDRVLLARVIECERARLFDLGLGNLARLLRPLRDRQKDAARRNRLEFIELSAGRSQEAVMEEALGALAGPAEAEEGGTSPQGEIGGG